VPVLAHRLSLTTQAWADGTRAADVVSSIVAAVAGPPAVGQRSSAVTS
jgi:MoxR-like ATPase